MPSRAKLGLVEQCVHVCGAEHRHDSGLPGLDGALSESFDALRIRGRRGPWPWRARDEEVACRLLHPPTGPQRDAAAAGSTTRDPLRWTSSLAASCYTFGIREALDWRDPTTGFSALCPYKYYPVFVSLDGAELEEYDLLTDKLVKYLGREDDPDAKQHLELLLFKRAAIVKEAAQKIDALHGIVDAVGTAVPCARVLPQHSADAGGDDGTRSRGRYLSPLHR